VVIQFQPTGRYPRVASWAPPPTRLNSNSNRHCPHCNALEGLTNECSEQRIDSEPLIAIALWQSTDDRVEVSIVLV
jgi:hypothetical protein